MSTGTRFFGMALVTLAASAGCARLADVASPGDAPRSASSRDAALEGVWEGQIWETPADYAQGVRRVTINISREGSWKATIGGAECASGVTTLRDEVVILGSRAPAGPPCVPYSLERDRERMWGEFPTSFKGRSATAAIELVRVRERAQEAASTSGAR